MRASNYGWMVGMIGIPVAIACFSFSVGRDYGRDEVNKSCPVQAGQQVASTVTAGDQTTCVYIKQIYGKVRYTVRKPRTTNGQS